MPVKYLIVADYWAEIKRISKSTLPKQAAIAFMTRDLVGFNRGDKLIVNASSERISSGATDARLLRSLQRKGVTVYCCDNLHAKILLLGKHLVVGSGNMSANSSAWLEAAYLTDDKVAVGRAKAFFEQLIEKIKPPLTPQELNKLCEIEVVRRGGGPPTGGGRIAKIEALGKQSWIVSVRELELDPPSDEAAMIAKAHEQIGIASDRLDWIRMPGKGSFVRDAKPGDLIVVIERPIKGPIAVYRPTPVLLKQKGETWTRFYYEAPRGRGAKRPWKKFVQLVKTAKHSRKLLKTSVHAITPDVIQRLIENW